MHIIYCQTTVLFGTFKTFDCVLRIYRVLGETRRFNAPNDIKSDSVLNNIIILYTCTTILHSLFVRHALTICLHESDKVTKTYVTISRV